KIAAFGVLLFTRRLVRATHQRKRYIQARDGCGAAFWFENHRSLLSCPRLASWTGCVHQHRVAIGVHHVEIASPDRWEARSATDLVDLSATVSDQRPILPAAAEPRICYV